jgi:hypothetical protein
MGKRQRVVMADKGANATTPPAGKIPRQAIVTGRFTE